ncbi:MAG: phage tail protein, partial [Ilumatobacteraceae bacterium]
MAFLAIAPTGTVLPFAGTAAPEGWVLCNSGEYLKTSSAYAKLFAVIGIAFGETNGSGGVGTTHFR